MKEKFNTAIKSQYKNKKIDVIAIAGDVIVFIADSKMIVASITKELNSNKEQVRATGENQELVNLLNYLSNSENGWNLVEDECDEYILVDGLLYRLSHEATVPTIKANHISSDTIIGDNIPLCI